MARLLCAFALFLLSVFAATTAAIAQDTEEAERSRFERFVENQISSPTMQVRLIGLDGALSSEVSLERITVSDDDGIWLTIEQPRLVWNRGALLRGRLDIEELSAEALDFVGRPIADESLPAPEARQFGLPELPVAITIGELDLPRASFGETVFGLASVLSLNGSLALQTGAIDADLAIRRLDGPGGELTLDASLSDDQLDLNARLTEPADGVVANLINLPDRPPVSLELTGGGTLDALDIDLSFDVDGARILDGALDTRRGLFAGATTLDFTLGGPLADILPARERAFFGNRTDLSGQLRFDDDGGTIIDTFSLASGVLNATATGELLADGFLAVLDADVALDAPDGPVALPGPSQITLQSARLALDYGGSDWSLSGTIGDLVTQDTAIAALTLAGGGQLNDLADPDARSVTYDIGLDARGLALGDPALARAVGDRVDISALGGWQAGAPLGVEALDIVAAASRVTGVGAIEQAAFDGTMTLETSDLAPFSGLAGRDLSGTAALALTGRVQPIGGAFDVMLDGGAEGLRAGDDLTGRLLAGDLSLAGGIARTVDGLSFSSFEGRNDQVSFAVSGTLASATADLRAALSLADLALINDRSSGSAGVQIAVDRAAPAEDETTDAPPSPFAVNATLLVPEGSLAGQAVTGLRIGFAGEWLDDRLDGRLDGGGTLADQPIEVMAQITREGTALSVEDMALTAGAGRIAGNLTYTVGLARGDLQLRATDIAGLAALALTEATGQLDADIALSADGGSQNASISAGASGVTVNDIRIGEAAIEAALRDLLGTPTGTATITARGINANGQLVERLNASVAPSGSADTLAFEGDAALAGGIGIGTRGTAAFGPTTDLEFAVLDLDTPYGDAGLAAPARIILDNGTTRLEQLALLVEGGRVTATGTVGDQLAVDATFANLPLSLINTVQPGLGIAGTLGGEARLRGTPSSPSVAFALNGLGLDATQIRQAGVAPFDVRASGRFADNQLRLTSLNAGNSQGAQLSASGTVPIAGGGMNVSASGAAPLALANRFLAARGTRLEGDARFEATITGSTARPAIAGLFSIPGGRITDPQSNLELVDVNVLAGFDGDRVIIRNASAAIRQGGGLSLSGTVGLAAGNPADLTLEIAGARFSDGQLYSADLGGRLTIAGPLAGGALIAGQIDIARADITVPETFAGDSDLLAVEHVGADPATSLTLARIEAILPKARGEASAPYRLDIAINAPNQVFVRGRGLDAELGGRIAVSGPVNAPRPVGAFNLIRGRLAILNRRLDFTEGSITLSGSLDPFLRLTASTTSGDLTAFVTLTGPASDLRLELSSSPALPEDEILARILFGEDIGSLSATQLAQLASAAASLAGGDSDLAGGLRGALGLDDLDLVQGDDGGVGVRAGRYISDNAYLEVEAGSDGAETSINLDITDSLTARGSARTDGNTSLGVFFERDY